MESLLNKEDKISSQIIKKAAKRVGFDLCGIAELKPIPHLREFYSQWLAKGYQGNQEYLERHFEKKLDPSLVYIKAKSAIVVAKSYLPAEKKPNKGFKFSKYATGGDYHFHMKDKLHALLHTLKAVDNTLKGKVLVDSGATFEKYWAQQAGLGKITKNTLLTTPQYGSYVFLGMLFVNQEFAYDVPFAKDLCGSCSICLKACPNKAILPNYSLNSAKCISYQTIEAESPDKEMKYLNWVYGCDICQDVCPLNKRVEPTNWEAFTPKPHFSELSKLDWLKLSEAEFQQLIQDSAMDRISFQKFRENLLLNSSSAEVK